MMHVASIHTLSIKAGLLKRCFDITASFFGIMLTWPIMVLAFIIASIETKSFGLFIQKRMGKEFKEFRIFKIKTMKPIDGFTTNVTRRNDPRITLSGRLFRKTKIDELPQLFNVLFGKMSFVGPRPDVKEMYEHLDKEEWLLFTVRPGITGPATIKYKNEERLLEKVDDPETVNQEIFKDKVQLNMDYIKHYRFHHDLKYIIKTFLGGGS